MSQKMENESSEDEDLKAKLVEAIDVRLEKVVNQKSHKHFKSTASRPSLRRDKKSLESDNLESYCQDKNVFSDDFQKHVASKLASKLDIQLVEERVQPRVAEEDEESSTGIKLFSDSVAFVKVNGEDDDVDNDLNGDKSSMNRRKRPKPDLLAHRKHSKKVWKTVSFQLILLYTSCSIINKGKRIDEQSSQGCEERESESSGSSSDEEVKSVAVTLDWIKDKNTV